MSMATAFRFGDVVQPVQGSSTRLRSGAGWYDCAIVISEKPLMLTSPDADMLWCSAMEGMELEVIGQCDAHQLKKCMARLPGRDQP